MSRRLLLFDIDGTLLSSGPPASAAFSGALERVFGTAGGASTYRFEGRLDPVIVRELMEEAGIPAETVEARTREALDLYLDGLEEALSRSRPTLKPGIGELVPRVAGDPRAVTALLTGNVERGARIKLTAAGLWHHFAFGVWGDEAPARTGLGTVALARAAEKTGIAFRGEDCVVIGDSQHDVACGKAIGARVVAVTTGRTPRAVLEEAGADVVFDDLSDLDAAHAALFS